MLRNDFLSLFKEVIKIFILFIGLKYEGTVRNALRLLALPAGETHQLRYKLISNETIKRLKHGTNEEILIVMIDKTDKEFVYTPVRCGKIVGHEQILDRLFISIELGMYVSTLNLKAFNTYLRKIGKENFIPDINNDNINAEYVLDKPDIRLRTFKWITIDSNWYITIKQLESFRVMKNVIYYTYKIMEKNNILLPKNGLYKLKTGKQYILKIEYLNFGYQNHKVLIHQTGNVQIVHSNYFNVDINSNKIEILINISNNKSNISGIFLTCESAIISDHLIKFMPKRSLAKHLLIIAILVFYALINSLLVLFKVEQPTKMLDYIINLAPTIFTSITFYILYIINDRDKFF